ncbi:CARDB domain-containing protein [Chloroflexota bacterium]
MRRLIIALILALCLVPINSNPAAAQSVSDYFSYSYNVEFSKAEVGEGESFSATIFTQATCTTTLPLITPTQAQVTTRVIAEHQTSGARVTLNSSYVVTLTPFPSQAGQSTEITTVVPLLFPSGSQAGSYSVIGVVEEAKLHLGSILGWNDFTSYLPESQAMGTVTYVVSSAGGGDSSGGSSGGGGGGGGGGGSAGATNVTDVVTAAGRFTQEVTAKSEDRKVELTIPKNTIGKTRTDQFLHHITVEEKTQPPAPPENSHIIGLSYDLGPAGATFDPPINLTFSYDDSQLSSGGAEENLVVATWDSDIDKWVELESTVDPETNTITARVSHFSTFTILSPTLPAAFTTHDLSVTPAEAEIGQGITISILITNTGDLSGSYDVTLKIDNASVASKQVTLSGGESQKATFTTTPNVARTYTVTIDGLSAKFVVKAPSAFTTSDLSITPAEVNVGQEVTIKALAANTGDLSGSYKVVLKIDDVVVSTKEVTLAGGSDEEITFTTTGDTAGSYTVNVNGLSGTFAVKAPSAFTTSDLSITPAEVNVGQEVTIKALAANTGDLSGSYKVILKIDDIVVSTKEVTLAGGSDEEITFTTTGDTAGSYTVNVNGLSGTFAVKTKTSPEPITPTPVTPKSFNWWLIGGITAAYMILVIVIWQIIRHRRR